MNYKILIVSACAALSVGCAAVTNTSLGSADLNRDGFISDQEAKQHSIKSQVNREGNANVRDTAGTVTDTLHNVDKSLRHINNVRSLFDGNFGGDRIPTTGYNRGYGGGYYP